MNKPMLLILGAATLSLSACGPDPVRLTPRNTGTRPPAVGAPTHPPPAVGATSPQAPTDGEQTPVEPPPPDGSAPQLTELRLVGVNTAAFRSVLLPVVSVQVTSGGQQVPFTPAASGHLELTGSGAPLVLGTIGVPSGVDKVQVEVRIDHFGSFAAAGETGPLDTRVRPLRFEVATSALRAGRPAVLSLDVGRSVVQHQGGRMFLPQLQLRY